MSVIGNYNNQLSQLGMIMPQMIGATSGTTGVLSGVQGATNALTNNVPAIANNQLGNQQGIFGKAFDWLGSGNNLETVAGIGQTLAGLYMGNQQLKMGKRALDMQENFANKNLANSVQSYNTNLSDLAKARGYTQGQSQQEIDSYIANNRLTA